VGRFGGPVGRHFARFFLTHGHMGPSDEAKNIMQKHHSKNSMQKSCWGVLDVFKEFWRGGL